MAAIVAMMFLTMACSDSNNKDPTKPDNPEPPTNNGDWHVVPAGGGTIQKGDITLQFDAATFSSDVQVAVSETIASGITEDARSKFYQVTLPESGNLKPFTISLKCDGSKDDVYPLVKSLAYDIHSGKTYFIVFDIDATLSNGEIVATIPVLSSDGNERPSFTIGLGQCPPVVGTRTREGGFQFDYKESVSKKKYNNNKANYEKIRKLVEPIIPEASKLLESHGFSINTHVPYRLSSVKDNSVLSGTWGVHQPSCWTKDWNIVYLNEDNFFKYINEPQEFLLNQLKGTIIHETLHAITNKNHDPRSAYDICKQGSKGNDWSQFDEALGCWVEKFIGAKKIADNTKNWQKNFILEFYPHDRNQTACRECGYGMASFIEFMAKKAGDKEIVNIYKDFKDPSTDFRAVLKSFLSEKGIKFFDNNSYYDFAYNLMNNEIVPQIDINDCVVHNKGWVENPDVDDRDYMTEKEFTYKGDAYNYGVLVYSLLYKSDILKKYIDSLMVITQNNDGLLTRVYYLRDNNLELIGQCKKGEPFKIGVEYFCKWLGFDIRNGKGGLIRLFFTTTREEFKNDYSSLPSEINIRFEEQGSFKVSPTSLHFEASGGKQDVKIEQSGFKYQDGWAVDSCKSWVSVSKKDGGLSVSVKSNDTSKKRMGRIVACVSHQEIKQPSLEGVTYTYIDITQDAGKESGNGNYQFMQGTLEVNIYTGTWTYGYDSMGGIDFDANSNFLTVTPNGKGLHFEINYEKEENKTKESIKCQFDIDDLSLMESQKSKVTNFSWKRDTENWSGMNWSGTWGWDGMIMRQTQTIRFSTSSKFPQTGWEKKSGSKLCNVIWFAESGDINPSECYYKRWTLCDGGEEGNYEDIEEGKSMLDGSYIPINLQFKYVGE